MRTSAAMHTKSSMNRPPVHRQTRLLPGHSEFFHQFVESWPADRKLHSCAGQVSFSLIQSCFDHLPLQGFTSFGKSLAFIFCVRRRQCEVIWSNLSIFGHNGGPLN